MTVFVLVIGPVDQVFVGPFADREVTRKWVHRESLRRQNFSYTILDEKEKDENTALYGNLTVQEPDMLTYPRINLNGTSARSLVKEYFAAYDAVGDALTKLRAVTVHARDYQTSPDAAQEFAVAQWQHGERIAKLEAVYTDLAALIEHAQEHVR